jgi:putative ABC transport system permease protein
MFDLDKWQEIFYTIRQNKLRTFLTAFSVGWGIFMLVLLLGAGSGLQNGVEYSFRDDAMNSIWVYPNKTSIPYNGRQPGRWIRMTNEDLEYVSEKIPEVEFITARVYVSGNRVVRYKNNYSSFSVVGVHPDHMHLEKNTVIRGRYVNTKDVNENRKVIAIGNKVADILFKNSVDPIGKWINVNGVQFKVVGVFDDIGNEGEADDIYIPISTAQKAYGEGKNIGMMAFTIGAATLAESNRITSQVEELLYSRHDISPADEAAIRVRNVYEAFERIIGLIRNINIFVAVVGVSTILAGIVGVSNIMLIVVKERTKEIGIRKAIGATPGSIISLVLQESIFITLVAGYIGLLFGVGVIELTDYALSLADGDVGLFRNPEISFQTALFATGLLVFSGALAGFFPARSAAKVKPVVALRDD